jgi:hypothetical protein
MSIALVSLGYVGLPLVVAFGESGRASWMSSARGRALPRVLHSAYTMEKPRHLDGAVALQPAVAPAVIALAQRGLHLGRRRRGRRGRHSPGDTMYLVGVVEIVAGLIVLIARASAAFSSPTGSAASSSTCCSSAATATSPCATSDSFSARSPSPAWTAPIRPERRRSGAVAADPGLYCAAPADVAQLARASAYHAEGRGFESLQPLVRKARYGGLFCVLRAVVVEPMPSGGPTRRTNLQAGAGPRGAQVNNLFRRTRSRPRRHRSGSMRGAAERLLHRSPGRRKIRTRRLGLGGDRRPDRAAHAGRHTAWISPPEGTGAVRLRPPAGALARLLGSRLPHGCG